MPASPFLFAQKTFDKNFNFAEYKRYAWRQNRLVTRQHPDINEIMDLKIVKPVNQPLVAKGFVEVKDNPEFYIYYDGGGDMLAAAFSPTERRRRCGTLLTTTCCIKGCL
jgi:hypothetical protein